MNPRPHIIGLTGQSGAGKSTVSRVFAERGFEVIDADRVAREVVVRGSPCLKEISEAFGREVILPEGSLDRKRLGDIVFSDRERLRQLNGITYPYIIFRITLKIDSLREGGARFILLDAPTLFEAGADDMCSLIISVTADEDIRCERIMKRDGITLEQIKKRFSSQLSEQFFIAHSDHIIKNNGSTRELIQKAEEAADKIKEYYGKCDTGKIPKYENTGGGERAVDGEKSGTEA